MGGPHQETVRSHHRKSHHQRGGTPPTEDTWKGDAAGGRACRVSCRFGICGGKSGNDLSSIRTTTTGDAKVLNPTNEQTATVRVFRETEYSGHGILIVGGLYSALKNSVVYLSCTKIVERKKG